MATKKVPAPKTNQNNNDQAHQEALAFWGIGQPLGSKTKTKQATTSAPKAKKVDTVQKPDEEKVSIVKQKKIAVTEEILQAIADGLSQTDALSLIGLPYATWNAWLKADPALVSDVKRAELSLKIKHLRNIASHAVDDPRCSQWLLSRKFPKEFGDRAIVDMNTSTDDSKIIINVIQQVQKERHSDVIDVVPSEIEQDEYDEYDEED